MPRVLAAARVAGINLAVAALSLHLASSANDQDRPIPRQLAGSSFGVPNEPAAFDYVIIGGGTAGLTVASRLSEDPANSVAVIEAGGFYEITNGNLSQIPGDDVRWTSKSTSDVNPLVDWGFNTTPQAVISSFSPG